LEDILSIVSSLKLLQEQASISNWALQNSEEDYQNMTNDNETSRKLIYLSLNCEISSSFGCLNILHFPRVSRKTLKILDEIKR
jgi:hypothetical protein